MTRLVHKIAAVVSIVILLIVFYSCSVEKKFAREFVKNDSTHNVLVMPPAFLFKTSLKDYEVDDADELDEWVLDSLLYENSIYLKYIVDSVFLHDYYYNYCMELEELGFIVHNQDSLLDFLTGNPGAYIFNMAQIELEEYLMPIVEKAEFDYTLYYQVINLNAVNVNSWLEISSMNEEENKELLFSSLFITDELEGFFRYNYLTGNVKYDFEIDTLFLDEVYELAKLAGYLYAGYTFDYLMNQYIDRRMEEKGRYRNSIYYHYNRKPKYIMPAKEDQKFIPMED